MTVALLNPTGNAGLPEHRPLWNYLAAVARRLGVGPESIAIDHDTPVAGYLALDTRLASHPGRDLALWWDERHGWSAGVETHSGEDLLALAHLGGHTVVPPPSAVAHFLDALTRGVPPVAGPPPQLRAPRDYDDLTDLLRAVGWG